MLKVDDKGWNITLFHNAVKMTTCLCEHCNSVCCDAAELGCNHDDNDIFTYCKQCLCDLIEDTDGLCPINNHKNPIIASSRSLRRQISKSMVFCPFSATYNSQQHQQYNLNVIDTIGVEEGKECIILRNKQKNCEWKGTLNDLLHCDHLNQCAIANDPSFLYKQKVEDLEQQLKAKNDHIQQQIKSITELKIKLDITNDKNQQLQLQVDDLVAKQDITNCINQSFKKALSEQVGNNDQLSETVEEQKQEILKLKEQIHLYNSENDDQKACANSNVNMNIDDIGEDEWTKWRDPKIFVQFVKMVISQRIEPVRSILSVSIQPQTSSMAGKQLQKYLESLQLIQRNMVKLITEGHDKQSIIAAAIECNDCVVATILWYNHYVKIVKKQTPGKITNSVSDALKNADLDRLKKKLFAIESE